MALYKSIMYSISIVFGWIVLKDTEILPWFMGGLKNGHVKYCWLNAPWIPQIPHFLDYLLFQLGYFFEDFIDHLIYRSKSNDHWEMNLHHLLTITMIAGIIV